ncbi:MAG: ABC transporter permease [Rhodoglobus sp.]
MMRAALATEAAKFTRARVPVVTSVMLTIGIAVLCSAMLGALGSGDPQLTAKLGALADPGGWVGFTATASQISAIAGLLGFGVVLSWMFGREFADGTVSGLFALPVGRGTIAAAKLLVYLAWAAGVSLLLVAVLIPLGLALGLGEVPSDAVQPLGRLAVVTFLTALLAIPAAWAATLGRGLLAGIGTIIGIVIAAQVAVLGGIGAWFPFSSPGMWATGAPVSITQLALVAPLAVAASVLVVIAWRRLQLDR